MAGPKFKFPTPSSCKLKDRSVLCTAERILILYNQSTEKDAKRISKSVKKWFVEAAKKADWAGCNFLPEVQSGHGAGCVLFIAPIIVNVNVKVTKTTLVLQSDTGDEE